MRYIKVAVIFALALLVAVSCNPYKNLKIEGVKILSSEVHGLKGADAVLEVEICNPSGKLAVTDVTGTVNVKGKPILDVTSEDFTLSARTTESVNVSVRCKFCSGIRFADILALASAQDLNDITADFKATVKAPFGIKKEVSVENLSAARLLEMN